jgi:hypothetical protein
VLGAIGCLAGLVVFLLFGMLESEDFTTAENWLFSVVCCLLPIGGTGAILLAAGAAIWYARLRKR